MCCQFAIVRLVLNSLSNTLHEVFLHEKVFQVKFQIEKAHKMSSILVILVTLSIADQFLFVNSKILVQSSTNILTRNDIDEESQQSGQGRINLSVPGNVQATNLKIKFYRSSVFSFFRCHQHE